MRGALQFLFGMTGSMLILGPWAVLIAHRLQTQPGPAPAREEELHSPSPGTFTRSVIGYTNWSDAIGKLGTEPEARAGPAWFATEEVQEMAWTMALTEGESELDLIVLVKYPEEAEFRLGSIWLRREAICDILPRSTGWGFHSDGPLRNGRRSGHGEHTDFNVRHENGLVVRIRHSKYNNENNEHFGCAAEFSVNAGVASMKLLSDGTCIRWEFRKPRK